VIIHLDENNLMYALFVVASLITVALVFLVSHDVREYVHVNVWRYIQFQLDHRGPWFTAYRRGRGSLEARWEPLWDQQGGCKRASNSVRFVGMSASLTLWMRDGHWFHAMPPTNRGHN